MTDRMCWLLCSEQLATFPPKKETASLNYVINKKIYIIKSEEKHKLNYDVFSRNTGFMLVVKQ